MTSTSEVTSPSTNGQAVCASAGAMKMRLGEELPIFCESCGYNLNGLPQSRCEHCTILQFHCPECGHHQPINTLRPAVQKVLGRARALVLALFVFFKINFFFWMLFAWVVMGAEWSYRHNSESIRTVIINGRPVQQQIGPRWIPHPITLEQMIGFCVLASVFGTFGRMMLLRWRRGWCVGLVLGALVMGAIALGAHLSRISVDDPQIRSPFTNEFVMLMLLTGVVIWTAASVVWAIWSMLVNVFLPRRAAIAVLDWQRHRTHGPIPSLARE